MGGGWTEYHENVVRERAMGKRVEIEDSVSLGDERASDEFVARLPKQSESDLYEEKGRGLTKEEIKDYSVLLALKSNTKDTNPKDAVGVRKAPVSTVSQAVIAEIGLGMLEGARKYGRHNYRVAGVRASVYRDAAWRHLSKWWEGEDIDKDSGLNHIIKALACLTVLRDAMIVDNWIDDRPPAIPKGFWEELDEKAAAIIEKYPDAKEPFTNEANGV